METSIKLAQESLNENLFFGLSYNNTETGENRMYYVGRPGGAVIGNYHMITYMMDKTDVGFNIVCSENEDIYNIFMVYPNTVIGRKNGKMMFVEYFTEGDVIEFLHDYLHRMRKELQSKDPKIIRQWVSL